LSSPKSLSSKHDNLGLVVLAMLIVFAIEASVGIFAINEVELDKETFQFEEVFVGREW
jgi:hypothetical protein